MTAGLTMEDDGMTDIVIYEGQFVFCAREGEI